MTEVVPYAVLDIDGVLADVRHRLHHLQSRPKDWVGFFGAAPQDPPLPEGVDLALRLAADHAIVYVTGRPERCRQDTLDWFARHGLPAGRLLMRRDDDRRPARYTKVETLRRLQAERPVATMVDDDADVVAAVRAAGFTIQHATWMHEDATQQQTLFDAQEHEGRT